MSIEIASKEKNCRYFAYDALLHETTPKPKIDNDNYKTLFNLPISTYIHSFIHTYTDSCRHTLPTSMHTYMPTHIHIRFCPSFRPKGGEFRVLGISRHEENHTKNGLALGGQKGHTTPARVPQALRPFLGEGSLEGSLPLRLPSRVWGLGLRLMGLGLRVQSIEELRLQGLGLFFLKCNGLSLARRSIHYQDVHSDRKTHKRQSQGLGFRVLGIPGSSAGSTWTLENPTRLKDSCQDIMRRIPSAW